MNDELTKDRAWGALAGVAIGDAMGMPSQTMARSEIFHHYGQITDFVEACASQPVSAGLKAGTVTDDMEQTLLLARHLIEHDGRVEQRLWAKTLLEWEQQTRTRGVNDLLGPSTKLAVEALLNGIGVEYAGRKGTTNGAAMRIVPAGIANLPEPLASFLDSVEHCCKLTHNTGIAIAAAASVAAVVSMGLNGASFSEAMSFALRAAQEAEKRGAVPAEGMFLPKLFYAIQLSRRSKSVNLGELAQSIGTSVAATESVPMAFAIALHCEGDPWSAAVLSSNVGDDTDTIGAIACGMLGACSGLTAFPPDKWEKVSTVNNLHLCGITEELLALRTGPGHGRKVRVAS
jgi:ADP-ribosylglycohydrolase